MSWSGCITLSRMFEGNIPLVGVRFGYVGGLVCYGCLKKATFLF